MRRAIAVLGVAPVAVASLILGSALASSVPMASSGLGAGTTPVARCDIDGIEPVFVLSGGDVGQVSISGIAAACSGRTLNLSITNGTVVRTGSVVVPSGGGTVTVTLSSDIPVTNPNVLQTDVRIS